MDKLIYMSVHLVCLVYILYKVWGWKSKVYEICILLYEKKSEKNFVNEKPFDSSVPIDETDVIGHTRFVFLDENVGETVPQNISKGGCLWIKTLCCTILTKPYNPNGRNC